ncbi:MAG: PAS domain S-box protein [bacterium]|nr:PAS domain S-box protein [bacterium]
MPWFIENRIKKIYMFNRFVFKIIIPALLAILLFVISIYLIVLPAFEKSMMDLKREMIRELTNSAWNILAKYESDEKQGILTREKAQAQAIAQFSSLYYGHDMKDYFWINDLEPRMLVHPYRKDLNDRDLSNIRDKNGKKIFLEFVNIVKNKGSGYIEYMWQWKDDDTRIVPKISYVKIFEPWEWVIGTGIYVDDVKKEINDVKRKVIYLSLGIMAGISLLLLIIVLETCNRERGRIKAEVSLKESEEKYRVLVDSAGESIIMMLDEEYLYANHKTLNMLGYTFNEFSKLKITDVIIESDAEKEAGYTFYQGLLDGLNVPKKYKSKLQKKDNSFVEVMLTISRIDVGASQGFIAIASDINISKEIELIQDKLTYELQSGLVYMNQTVKNMCNKNICFFSCKKSIRKAYKAMLECKTKILIIVDDKGHPAGSLSEADITGQILEKKYDADSSVENIMRTPLSVISEKAMLFEAILKMDDSQVDYIFIEGNEKKITGILTEKDLLNVQRCFPSIFMKEIEKAKNAGELIQKNKQTPYMVRNFVLSGVEADSINRFITTNSDIILKKFIAFAIEELGPPPRDFVFLVMGSEGRYEQTLKTDQDNAIIYEDVLPDEEKDVKKYFLQMGEKVCNWLDLAGFTFCEGEIMANNPKWCKSFSEWNKTFHEWINTMEGEDLLNTKIFFDFRGAYGNMHMVSMLRKKLYVMLDSGGHFFYHMAQNVLLFGPPLGFFGGFVVKAKDKKNKKGVDIKHSLLLIIDFVRVYALKNKISAINTIERLTALSGKNVFDRRSYDELVQAFNFLMKLRFKKQAEAVANNESLDNMIDPKSLTYVEQKMLKEIYAQIKSFQSRLSYDFTGMPG